MEKEESSSSGMDENVPSTAGLSPEEASDDKGQVASCDQTMEENSSSMESSLPSYSGACGEAETESKLGSNLGSYRERPQSESEESVSTASLVTVGTATTASMTSSTSEETEDSSSSKPISQSESSTSSEGSLPKFTSTFQGRFTELQRRRFCLTGSKRGGNRTRSPELGMFREIHLRIKDLPLTTADDSEEKVPFINLEGSSESSLDLPTVTQDMTSLQIGEGASEQVEEKSDVSPEKSSSLKRKRSPDAPQQEGSGNLPKRARYVSQSGTADEGTSVREHDESEETEHSEAALKSSTEKTSVEETASASVSVDESKCLDDETGAKSSQDEEDSSAKGMKRRSLSPDETDVSEKKKMKKSDEESN